MSTKNVEYCKNWLISQYKIKVSGSIDTLKITIYYINV